MQSSMTITRFVISFGLVTLGACSSGGNGTAPVTTPPTASSSPPAGDSGSSGDAASSTTLNIGAPGAASLSGNSPTLAAGAYTPTAGTAFALNQSVEKVTTSSVTDVTGDVGGATVTYRSSSALGAARQQIALTVPSLGLDVQNLQGTSGSGGGGNGIVGLTFAALTYTAISFWTFTPSGSSNFYAAYGVSGYQTPTAGVPAGGTGVYAGSNPGTNTASGVMGTVSVPNGDNTVASASLFGDATVNINFATGAINGNLSNLKTGSGSSSAAWNNVNLSGNLSGATMSGSTSTAAVNGGGNFTLPGNATGKFNGALYGPNGQELGAVWSLADPANNKSALGVVGAKQ